MQSPEYPDLPFVTPASWTRGRGGMRPKLVVIHYTAGSERSTSAEDGAAYDQRRDDGTSCHYFHDSDSTVQCVLTSDTAHSAFFHGNRLGIQHELCGTQQTRAQWLDPASDATLWRAARQAARDCAKWGIQVRKIGPAETRAAYYDGAPGGICGHADVTLAFPEDNGDHMDPGAEFPWDIFIARVQLAGGDDMAGEYSPDTACAIAFGGTSAGRAKDTGVPWDGALEIYNLKAVEERLNAKIAESARTVALTDADRASIAAQVKAGLLADLAPLIDLAKRIGNG